MYPLFVQRDICSNVNTTIGFAMIIVNENIIQLYINGNLPRRLMVIENNVFFTNDFVYADSVKWILH